jgi:DNA-binding helix-hairpin-helix protein with protein kinase domain
MRLTESGLTDLVTVSKEPVVVEQRLGEGGQGEVYRVRSRGQLWALKLYHSHTSTPAQRQSVERLIQKGPPTAHFLWPLELVISARGPRFGYLMELREPRFRHSEDFMARRVEPTFRALLTAGFQLAEAFWKLHAQGLCYRDISFGNVFFDPNTGDVRICDNDNVDLNGSGQGGVIGTPKFMAPEVVRGEEPPSAQTDRFSLAVLLFYLLEGGHPLDGERESRIHCLDLPAMNKLYGTDPLYIFDPKDVSNRPVPGLHVNPLAFHPLYPKRLQELFLQSFTDGLHSPNRRVMESVWCKELAKLRDTLVYCQKCTSQCFYDAEVLKAQKALSCWSCRAQLRLPPRLRIGDHVILLNHDARLFSHHVNDDLDFEQAIAEVRQKPGDPSVWGLCNLTQEKWTFTRPDGSTVDVPPGTNVPLTSGNTVNFGPVRGEIRL